LLEELDHLVAGFPKQSHDQQWTTSLYLDDREGNDIRGCAHDGANDQLTESALAFVQEVDAKSVKLDEKATRETYHLAAQRGGLHTSRQSLEQVKSKNGLHVAQQLRSARLSEMNGLRSAMQVSVIVEGDQQRELLESKAAG
jgi:hypothetical protein